MITSVFKKSTPINYSLLMILVLCFFFLYQFQDTTWTNSVLEIGKKIGLLIIITGSFFLVNFISKKNGLTKDSAFTMFFFLLFMLVFPSLWNNYNLILANFFVLLAMRRLVSLQTLKAPKEKIFDASLWIFLAAFFNFWCILFLLVVYISIIFHVSRDYRNWLIPFVALFTTLVLFISYHLLIDSAAIDNYIKSISYNLQLDYFINNYQNLALSIFAVLAVFFVIPMMVSLTNRPLNLQASYKKLIFSFFIGIVIFIISINKSNDLLVFTFFPMAVLATNTIEYSQNKLQQEIILFVTVLLSLFAFFVQL
jgi:hypothetical protein